MIKDKMKAYSLFLLLFLIGCSTNKDHLYETGAGNFEGIYAAHNLYLWVDSNGIISNEDGQKFDESKYYEAIRETVAKRGRNFGVTLCIENEQSYKYLGNILKAFSARVDVYMIQQPPPPIK